MREQIGGSGASMWLERAMRLAPVRDSRFAPGTARRPPRRAPRERRGLVMPRASGLVEVVFEPIDLLAQLVAVSTIPVAVPIRALVLAPQALDLTTLTLDLALLPREFVNQLVACRGSPSREHASVMPRLKNLYKYKCSDLQAPTPVIGSGDPLNKDIFFSPTSPASCD
jgi:hypothetical protein